MRACALFWFLVHAGTRSSAVVAASCCSQILSKSHSKLTCLPFSCSSVNPEMTSLAALFMDSVDMGLRGQIAHSRPPRRGVPSLKTHFVHHVLSPSPSRAACALQFLVPVKGFYPPTPPIKGVTQSRSGKASHSLHDSSSFQDNMLHFHSLPPTQFHIPLLSLRTLCAPSASHTHPHPVMLWPPCPRLSCHPQIPPAASGGLWFMAGHVLLRCSSDPC